MQASVALLAPTKRVRLPRSSTRQQNPYDLYCKVLTDIIPEPFGAALFAGKIYKPGAVVELAALPDPAVVIECAGQIGAWQRGKRRDFQYILWTYDRQLDEWHELARAQAKDKTWTAGIREPAWLALHPRPELVDVIQRTRDITDEILELIDKRLRSELVEVRANALYTIYERVAGRISACA